MSVTEGHSGDECVLASPLSNYTVRKGDLFVLTWARMRRLRRGSISSELLMCDGGVRAVFCYCAYAYVCSATSNW